MPLPVASSLLALLLSGPALSPAPPPEPGAAPTPPGLVDVALLGLLGENDIFVRKLRGQEPQGPSAGPVVTQALVYRTKTWALVLLHLKNPESQPAWAQGDILLTVHKGPSVKILSARMSPPRLAPGEEGTLALVTEEPSWNEGERLHLVVHGADGSPSLPPLISNF